ncbi:MAG: M48 family peptidase [Alphaproteobacteria bacterium]|nr:MAG: M48 family peptidase [Alphaproteobacteria bacterium]
MPENRKCRSIRSRSVVGLDDSLPQKHRFDRDEFRARVRKWAEKLDIGEHSIYIRPMTRKWASCSTGGTLSFNDELLEIAEELRDYVIVHELLHFSVPNHGKLWKSLMRAHLGPYEELEQRLRQSVIPPGLSAG